MQVVGLCASAGTPRTLGLRSCRYAEYFGQDLVPRIHCSILILNVHGMVDGGRCAGCCNGNMSSCQLCWARGTAGMPVKIRWQLPKHDHKMALAWWWCCITSGGHAGMTRAQQWVTRACFLCDW